MRLEYTKEFGGFKKSFSFRMPEILSCTTLVIHNLVGMVRIIIPHENPIETMDILL